MHDPLARIVLTPRSRANQTAAANPALWPPPVQDGVLNPALGPPPVATAQGKGPAPTQAPPKKPGPPKLPEGARTPEELHRRDQHLRKLEAGVAITATPAMVIFDIGNDGPAEAAGPERYDMAANDNTQAPGIIGSGLNGLLRLVAERRLAVRPRASNVKRGRHSVWKQSCALRSHPRHAQTP